MIYINRNIGRAILLLGLFGTWFCFTSPGQRFRSLIGASVFYLIESTYCWIQGQSFHSTFPQFYSNIWSHPLIADVYFLFVAPAWSPVLRIVLYPLVIWSLEFVQCFTITSVYGKNVAWDYTGNKYSCMSGAIDLSMVFEWWLLGSAMEFVYMPYIYGMLQH